MKINKGDFGYIKSQRRKSILLTVLFAVIDFGVFAAGYYLNGGDRRNIYTIIAAVGGIPLAMAVVKLVMVSLRKPMDPELHREISSVSGDLHMMYELFLTTRDKNLFLDATAICGPFVACYTSEKKEPQYIAFMEDHIRKSFRQQGYKMTVKIFDQKDKYLERVAQLAEKNSDYEEDRYPFEIAIMQAISL